MKSSSGSQDRFRSAGSTREHRAAARREAIALAALEEFTARGYAATRIEDVARRAGVAKGTVYLHFHDKAALFEGIVQATLVTALDEIRHAPPVAGESVRHFLERQFVPLLAGLGATRRGDVLRLMISEGARVPELAAMYFREVITPGLAMIAALSARAQASGEIDHDLLGRFPQLLFAPALVGLVWGGLFEQHRPLDVKALLHAQLDLMFRPAPTGESR